MLLIRRGRFIDPKSGVDQYWDVLIDGGTIREIGPNLAAENCDVIDATGLFVAPGLVDTHVHFREPGQTHKEDIASGARSAARGGFTTVVCMANTVPPVDNPELLAQNLERGRTTGIHVHQAATVTQGMGGTALTDFAALKAAGTACLTDDGKPIQDTRLVQQAMTLAKELGMVLSFHEEDETLLKGHGVNEGEVSRQLGIAGAAAEAEDMLVNRDCMLALRADARIVIQHISSAAAVAMVRTVKAMGGDVHAEATPHHFSLTQEAVLKHGPLAKMNPPLRTQADLDAIIDGLRDGVIDIIATDHAPHSPQEKAVSLEDAPSGIIGLETALALGITNLVRSGHLDWLDFLAKLTWNPASCYGLDAGYLEVGGPADLVLFDPEARWIVENFASKSKNSPFVGQTLFGKVRQTICGGKTVYSDNQA